VTLLFLESLGSSELLVILIVALIVFGPRKLPELGRSLGKGLGEFKRASDEFKQTWEREVNLDSNDRERRVGEAMLPPESRREELPAAATENMIASPDVKASEGAQTIARGASAPAGDAEAHAMPIDPDAPPIDSGSMLTNPYATPPATNTTTDLSAGHEAGEVAPQSPHKTEWL
jgi:TatA/E family protein of Tat protein translocase